MMLMMMTMMMIRMEPESPGQFLLVVAFGTDAKSQPQLPFIVSYIYDE